MTHGRAGTDAVCPGGDPRNPPIPLPPGRARFRPPVTGQWRGRLAVTGSAAALAVVAALLALGATSAGSGKPTVSHPRAPGFSLAVLGHPGQHISLAQYAGRPLVINFFASWCEPCQRETPLIARFYRTERGRVTILGVDVNDLRLERAGLGPRGGLGYQVLTDPEPMTTTLAYGVVALPQTFFLNAQHRIVKRVIRAVTVSDLRAGVAMLTSQSKRS